MDLQGILGIDDDVRNGFGGIKVTYKIDADAKREDIEALVAQSQKRSAVSDIVTNPTNVTVVVNHTAHHPRALRKRGGSAVSPPLGLDLTSGEIKTVIWATGYRP